MLVKKKQDKSVLFKVTILKFEPSNLYIFSLQMLDRFFHLRISNYLYYILSSNQNLYSSTYIHLPISIQAYSYSHTIYSYPSTNIHPEISICPYPSTHTYISVSISYIHIHLYISINILLSISIYPYPSIHFHLPTYSYSIYPYPSLHFHSGITTGS